MYFSACFCVTIPNRMGSSKLIASASITSGSDPTLWTNSISLSIPMAFIATHIGTSSASVLCLRNSRPFLMNIYAFDFLSLVELVMDAETQPVLGSSSIITLFFDNCSCINITFSTPLIMKYPPGSYGHSFISANSLSDFPRSRHFDERSMIGIRPITTFFLTTICRPRVYRTLTYMGALYVQSRSLHWNGVVCVVA